MQQGVVRQIVPQQNYGSICKECTTATGAPCTGEAQVGLCLCRWHLQELQGEPGSCSRRRHTHIPAAENPAGWLCYLLTLPQSLHKASHSSLNAKAFLQSRRPGAFTFVPCNRPLWQTFHCSPMAGRQPRIHMLSILQQ